LNPNKFFILQRRNQIPMMITYKKRVKWTVKNFMVMEVLTWVSQLLASLMRYG
jgi:hypothetical protein